LSLELYLQTIDNEKDIIEQINNFNKKYHPEKYKNEKSLGDIFEKYLIKKEKLVDETIVKIKSFSNSEQ
jgi:hypothetical protein